MTVLIRSETKNHYSVSIDHLRSTAEQLLDLAEHDNSELSILLISDNGIQKLNNQYRQRPKPTNVLSFPIHQKEEIKNGVLLGDIVISLDTATKEAESFNITTWQHTVRLLIHGLVHLLGYDHELSEHDAFIMESEEKKLIENLNNITGEQTCLI